MFRTWIISSPYKGHSTNYLTRYILGRCGGNLGNLEDFLGNPDFQEILAGQETFLNLTMIREAGWLNLKWLTTGNSGLFTFRIEISITNAVVRNYQLAFDWFQLIDNFAQNNTVNTQIHSKEYEITTNTDCGGLPMGFEEYRRNLRFALWLPGR